MVIGVCSSNFITLILKRYELMKNQTCFFLKCRTITIYLPIFRWFEIALYNSKISTKALIMENLQETSFQNVKSSYIKPSSSYRSLKILLLNLFSSVSKSNGLDLKNWQTCLKYRFYVGKVPDCKYNFFLQNASLHVAVDHPVNIKLPEVFKSGIFTLST